MTVSYNQDIINSQTLTFLRVLFRWKGSLWKSVSYEVLLWTASYYMVMVAYRSMLSNAWQIQFEHTAKYMDAKMDASMPLIFMLGFFVSFVVDRWKQIFANIGFVDSFAFFIATYIRGSDQQSRMVRRNLVRYLCLTQVLVLRDISVKVRKRFPTTESIVDSGLLQSHEQMLMEINENGFPKYWMPIHWIFTICHDLHERNQINGAFYDNILQEAKKFREQLQALLNYDWVPVPLAYPQVVFFATRFYFFLCLFTRQFRIHEQVDSHVFVEYYFPVMTLLQLTCLMGWLKVAEALLNPMGDDDDDYECNYIIDRNIAVGMTMVDECYGQMPKQSPDTIGIEGQRAMYSEKSANDTQNPLVGSATLADGMPEEGEAVKMVERKPTMFGANSDDQARKKSRLSRVFRPTFRRRRASEPVQFGSSSPSFKPANNLKKDGAARFAASDGGNILVKEWKNGGKPSQSPEVNSLPAKSLQTTDRRTPSPQGHSPRSLEFRNLERVSEEEDGTSVESGLDNLAMAELGLDLEEFKKSRKNGMKKNDGGRDD